MFLIKIQLIGYVTDSIFNKVLMQRKGMWGGGSGVTRDRKEHTGGRENFVNEKQRKM